NDVTATIVGTAYSAVVPLQEGANTITVIARDSTGNTGTQITTILLDTTAPQVTIDTVTTPTNLATQTIIGTVVEDNLESVTVNDVTATIVGTAYSAVVPLLEGMNTITVIATDASGNAGTQTASILLDTTAPQFSIGKVITPTNIATQTITGTVEENINNVTVNGVEATVQGSTYSAVVSLLEGANTITVIATDISGNAASEIAAILLDTIAPQFTISEVTNPTNIATQTITGTVEENINNVTVNGVAATVQGSTYSAIVSLLEGANTITVIATDTLGNAARLDLNIILDTTAPVIQLTANPLDHISLNNPMGVYLDLSEDDLYSASISILDSEEQEVYTQLIFAESINEHTFIWNSTDDSENPLPNGNYDMTIVYTDAVGNAASVEKALTVDNEDPYVIINQIIGTGIDNGSVYSNSLLIVEAAAYGTPDDVSSVEFILKSKSTELYHSVDATFVDGVWSATFDISSFPDGEMFITANSSDAANNVNTTVSDTVIIVDHKLPEFPAIVTKYDENNGMISIISSEKLSQINLFVNSEPIILEMNNNIFTGYFALGELTDFNINITGSDIAGNSDNGSYVAHIGELNTENDEGVFQSSVFGTSIVIYGTGNASGELIVTETQYPAANMVRGSNGMYFFTVELDTTLGDNMSSAKIFIPFSQFPLPAGVTHNDFSICYYNGETNTWDTVDTNIENIDGENYWVASVGHFSTYGLIETTVTAPEPTITPKKFSKGSSNGDSGARIVDIGSTNNDDPEENDPIKDSKKDVILDGVPSEDPAVSDPINSADKDTTVPVKSRNNQMFAMVGVLIIGALVAFAYFRNKNN
ncbi:hypothetical protein HNV12_12250, partial [Methanococcoides sp. SA1]|nr:hypothetical protein [Methanococcoides sp. SA1]